MVIGPIHSKTVHIPAGIVQLPVWEPMASTKTVAVLRCYQMTLRQKRI